MTLRGDEQTAACPECGFELQTDILPIALDCERCGAFLLLKCLHHQKKNVCTLDHAHTVVAIRRDGNLAKPLAELLDAMGGAVR